MPINPLEHQKVDSSHLRSKSHSTLSPISSTFIQKKDIPKELIIQILKKSFSLRTKEDLRILSQFVLSSKLISKFNHDGMDSIIAEKIIVLSSVNFVLKNFKENEIIYKSNDEADFFYIILNGEITLQEPVKEKKLMTGYEYYLLLRQMKKSGHKFLIEKTIDENYSFFHFNPEEIKNMEKIMTKLLLINKQDNDNLKVGDLLKQVDVNYDFFGISREEKDNSSEEEESNGTSKEEIEKEYFQIIKEKVMNISSFTCQKYLYFLDSTKKYWVEYYKYIDSSIISDDYYFGDLVYNKYVHLAFASKNSFVLCIDNQMYKEYIYKENKKKLSDEVSFFLDNFFFGTICRQKFQKSYFKLFKKEHYIKGQVICKENEKINCIIFIKKGKFTLTSNNSVVDNHILINYLHTIIKKSIMSQCEYLSKEERNKKKEEITQIEKDFSSMFTNVTLNNEPNTLKKELNQKQIHTLINLENIDIIGIESFNYGCSHLYTATVTSDDADVYTLPTKGLIKIFKDKNEECFYSFQRKAYQKIKMLYDRLIQLNQGLISQIDKNYTRKNSPPTIKESPKKNINFSLNNSLNIKKEDLPNIKKIIPKLSTSLTERKIIKKLFLKKAKVDLEENRSKYVSAQYGKSIEDRMIDKLKKENNGLNPNDSFSFSNEDNTTFVFYKNNVNKMLKNNSTSNINHNISTANSSYFLSRYSTTKQPYNPSKLRVTNEKISKYKIFDNKNLANNNNNTKMNSLLEKFVENHYNQFFISQYNLKQEKLLALPFNIKLQNHINYSKSINEKLNKVRYYE